MRKLYETILDEKNALLDKIEQNEAETAKLEKSMRKLSPETGTREEKLSAVKRKMNREVKIEDAARKDRDIANALKREADTDKNVKRLKKTVKSLKLDQQNKAKSADAALAELQKLNNGKASFEEFIARIDKKSEDKIAALKQSISDSESKIAELEARRGELTAAREKTSLFSFGKKKGLGDLIDDVSQSIESEKARINGLQQSIDSEKEATAKQKALLADEHERLEQGYNSKKSAADDASRYAREAKASLEQEEQTLSDIAKEKERLLDDYILRTYSDEYILQEQQQKLEKLHESAKRMRKKVYAFDKRVENAHKIEDKAPVMVFLTTEALGALVSKFAPKSPKAEAANLNIDVKFALQNFSVELVDMPIRYTCVSDGSTAVMNLVARTIPPSAGIESTRYSEFNKSDLPELRTGTGKYLYDVANGVSTDDSDEKTFAFHMFSIVSLVNNCVAKAISKGKIKPSANTCVVLDKKGAVVSCKTVSLDEAPDVAFHKGADDNDYTYGRPDYDEAAPYLEETLKKLCETNDEFVSLLTLGKFGRKDITYDMLREKGYILRLGIDDPDRGAACNVALASEAGCASVYVWCKADKNKLDNYTLRDVKLSSMICDAVNSSDGAGSRRLRVESSPFDGDEERGIKSVYVFDEGADSSNRVNPFETYGAIYKLICERLCRNTDLAAIAGIKPDECSAEKFIDDGVFAMQGRAVYTAFLKYRFAISTVIGFEVDEAGAVEYSVIALQFVKIDGRPEDKTDKDEALLQGLNNCIEAVLDSVSGAEYEGSSSSELFDKNLYCTVITMGHKYVLHVNPDTFKPLVGKAEINTNKVKETDNDDDDNPESITKPNFFAALVTLASLTEKIGQLEPAGNIEFTIDIMDLPLWLSFKADKSKFTMAAYDQVALYSKDETKSSEVGRVEQNRKTGKQRWLVGKEMQEVLGELLGFCIALAGYIQTSELNGLMKQLRIKEEGILLMWKAGKLKWRVVSGYDRPMLSALPIGSNEPKMMRTYFIDVAEETMLEGMSFEELIKAAENGSIHAAMHVANAYMGIEPGVSVRPDPAKAARWYKVAADVGESLSMYNLGVLYYKGSGVARNESKALDLFERAAELGDSDAETAAEQIKTFKKLVKKAEAGNANAQADLAEWYMAHVNDDNGLSEKESFAESVKWARMAEKRNVPKSMKVLALAYEHGRGVQKNERISLRYYQRGADLGDLTCMSNLAIKYLKGENGAPRDENSAFSLAYRAAKRGYGPAMTVLATCYQYGYGCTHSSSSAAEWYAKAAKALDDPELAQRAAIFATLPDY